MMLIMIIISTTIRRDVHLINRKTGRGVSSSSFISESSKRKTRSPTIIRHLGFYNKNDHFKHSALNSRKKVIKKSSNRNAPCNRIFLLIISNKRNTTL